MNTIQSQKLGWAALTVCCLTGAYIGRSTELAKDKRGMQHASLVEQRKKFDAAVLRIAERKRNAKKEGPWESGDGTTCANADSDVPSGQGDGKYGAIGSWNVGKVTDMGYSECPSLSLFHF